MFYRFNMLKRNGIRSTAPHASRRQLAALYTAFSRCTSAGEFEAFLLDLCTPAERAAMAERWAVVNRLHAGLSYRRVSKLTGASTATVTRVARWLHAGAGGYQRVLARAKGRKIV